MSRAHPFRVLQPIRRYSRAQERSPVLFGLGCLLPAPSTPQPGSHTSPHSPRVPRLAVWLRPCPRVRPRYRPSVCTPFPSLSCYLAGLGLNGLTRTPTRALPLRPPRSPPAASRLRSGLGVARPDSAPPTQRTRALPARPLPRAGRGEPGRLPLLLRSSRAPRALSLSRSPRRARSRPARSGLRLLPAPVSAVTALGNMATEGMILTNHDHQIRVGVLTGNPGGRCGTAAAAVPD